MGSIRSILAQKLTRDEPHRLDAAYVMLHSATVCVGTCTYRIDIKESLDPRDVFRYSCDCYRSVKIGEREWVWRLDPWLAGGAAREEGQALEKTLMKIAELGASPNGGPVEPPGNSGAGGGPPSVS